jgi:2-(1,2-epoxy-1,2-dihydrophenyl)acetyl-CoA isomerase
MSTPNEAPAQVLTRRDEDGVLWITLNRPDRLNAFAGRMRDELLAALRMALEPAARVVVITGAGRAFCAGADVEAMQALLEADDAETFESFVVAGMEVVRALRGLPCPVIAALNGVAAGAGASLAAACDLRVAAESASIGFTFNRIGLHPDWGSSYFLPRLVGAGRAAEIILTARMVSAEEAERIGLVEQVFPDAEFGAAVERLARELARKPPLALAAAKGSLARSSEATLDEMLERERAVQMKCFHSRDVREGVAAFREKRAARFGGE